MGRSAMMRSAPGEGAQCATGGGRGQASPRGCRRRLEQRSQKPTSEVYPRAESLAVYRQVTLLFVGNWLLQRGGLNRGNASAMLRISHDKSRVLRSIFG